MKWTESIFRAVLESHIIGERVKEGLIRRTSWPKFLISVCTTASVHHHRLFQAWNTVLVQFVNHWQKNPSYICIQKCTDEVPQMFVESRSKTWVSPRFLQWSSLELIVSAALHFNGLTMDQFKPDIFCSAWKYIRHLLSVAPSPAEVGCSLIVYHHERRSSHRLRENRLESNCHN